MAVGHKEGIACSCKCCAGHKLYTFTYGIKKYIGTTVPGLSDFMILRYLTVVLSFFTGGSPNTGIKYSVYVGRTGRDNREDNK